MTTFRSFDEQGSMLRAGRAAAGKAGMVPAGRAEAAQTGRLIYESRIPPAVIRRLEEMGCRVFAFDDWRRIMGGVNGCAILADGTLAGAADPRRDGPALGL